MYEYFVERKNKTFSDMNIILFENEQPKNIINSDYVEEPEFDKKEDFIEVKDDIIKGGDVILIKASLGMDLKKVTDSIVEG